MCLCNPCAKDKCEVWLFVHFFFFGFSEKEIYYFQGEITIIFTLHEIIAKKRKTQE